MDIQKTNELYQKITQILIDRNLSISTMESCTAGLVATMLTNRSGASAILKGAFVTYSNEAKIKQGVRSSIINDFGVYSIETAIDMAWACSDAYKADIGIGVTGILDRLDPNNTGNGVYAAISFGNTQDLMSFNIPDDIEDRFDRKLYVVNKIGQSLYKWLLDFDKMRNRAN